jgi:hypothetical protein
MGNQVGGEHERVPVCGAQNKRKAEIDEIRFPYMDWVQKTNGVTLQASLDVKNIHLNCH